MIDIYSEPAPDYNFYIDKGDIGKIAANRTVLCIFTDYGLLHNHKPNLWQYNEYLYLKNEGAEIRK